MIDTAGEYSKLISFNQEIQNALRNSSKEYNFSNELKANTSIMRLVVNYLIIQKYRYEDLFSVEYDIDWEAKKYKILKLVLQPFVENALYHGIRPKGIRGKISINIRHNTDSILLQIADDGMGMSKEEIDKLFMGKAVRENESFGIWGTIERLRIFYGVENIVSIESEKGCGTKVFIRIPLKGDKKCAGIC
jgi:two-component system sensor histidine kinase YesM